MKEKLKGKFTSDFAKNVAVMFSGNGLAMIFPFIMAPFISRLYSPEDFAGFELFVKIAVLVSVVSSLRLEQAIILPKQQSEADSLFKVSVKILVIFTLVSFGLSYPFRHSIGDVLDNKDLADLLLILPIAVLILGGFQILTAYAIRLRKFKTLASNKILASISNNGIKYILGLSAPISLNLVWGQIIGALIPALAFFQLKAVRTQVKTLFRQDVKTKVLLKKYRDFPVVNSSHAFFDEGQKAMLLFLVSAYHGALILGLFAFAWRYLKIPVQVFGNSLAQVLNEKWARDINNGVNIRPAVIKMILALFGSSIIPFTILFFFGTPIFAFVFGQEWAEAGRYAELIAPWLLFNFITSPISFLPILANKQKLNFAIAFVGNSITLVLVFVMSLMDYPFENIVIAIVISNVIQLILLMLWFIKISGHTKAESY